MAAESDVSKKNPIAAHSTHSELYSQYALFLSISTYFFDKYLAFRTKRQPTICSFSLRCFFSFWFQLQDALIFLHATATLFNVALWPFPFYSAIAIAGCVRIQAEQNEWQRLKVVTGKVNWLYSFGLTWYVVAILRR